MSPRHPKRRVLGEHFAQVPVEVLTSGACRTLRNCTFRVLIAIAAQYRGYNNGDLAMTWSMAREFGINSKKQLNASVAMLLERGLIQKTRQGGKKPLGPSLYALTWQRINDLGGKIVFGPTLSATNAWNKWTPAPPGVQTKKNQQHHRGGSAAPPGGQTDAKSAPQGVQSTPVLGTTGGAPSRSGGEGTTPTEGSP